MVDPFTLTISADERGREIAPLVAAKYAELAGGTAHDGELLATAVSHAIAAVAGEAVAGAEVELKFRIHAGQIEVHARCSQHARAVTHHLAASGR